MCLDGAVGSQQQKETGQQSHVSGKGTRAGFCQSVNMEPEVDLNWESLGPSAFRSDSGPAFYGSSPSLSASTGPDCLVGWCHEALWQEHGEWVTKGRLHRSLTPILLLQEAVSWAEAGWCPFTGQSSMHRLLEGSLCLSKKGPMQLYSLLRPSALAAWHRGALCV